MSDERPLVVIENRIVVVNNRSAHASLSFEIVVIYDNKMILYMVEEYDENLRWFLIRRKEEPLASVDLEEHMDRVFVMAVHPSNFREPVATFWVPWGTEKEVGEYAVMRTISKRIWVHRGLFDKLFAEEVFG